MATKTAQAKEGKGTRKNPSTGLPKSGTSGVSVQAAQPEWHHIDARGKVLGRLATDVAVLLLGKHRSDFSRHIVPPVYVVVTNTDKVALTGRKEEQKRYRHYTGYPGGLRERTVREQRAQDSRVIVAAAVEGMLPKNSLRPERMKHLKLYAGSEHPHLPQLGTPENS